MRSFMMAGALGMLVAASAVAQQSPAPWAAAAAPPGFISHGLDPECPGCRAFLAAARRGGAGTLRTPGCDSAAGTEAGLNAGEGMRPTADEALGAELLATDFGTGFGYDYPVSSMIGDFFGGTTQMLIGSAGQGVFDEGPPDPAARSNIPVAGGDRRFKVAENFSPYPIDRVFFNYHHFHNALLTVDGRKAHFNRGVFGVEKTFFSQAASVELRLPVGTGLNSTQTVDDDANNVTGEFGNIPIVFKAWLWESSTAAITAGMSAVLPTASDVYVVAPGAPSPAMALHNEAYYLQPFAALWLSPNDRFFVQLMGQFDFDARGNPVDLLDEAGNLVRAGILQDQNLLYLDAACGYWLFRSPTADSVITGLAPIVELHYTTTLQDTDFVNSGSLTGNSTLDQLRNFSGRIDVLNLTGGLRIEVAGRSFLTLFGVVPLRVADGKPFDSEFGVQYTRSY